MRKFPARQRAIVSALRSIREEANLSQRELSALLKEPHNWIQRIESMQRDVSVAEAAAIAQACGVAPLEFFRRAMR